MLFDVVRSLFEKTSRAATQQCIKRFGEHVTKPFLYTIFIHTQNVAKTCSTAQLLADNAVPPTMQNTHLSYIAETCSTMQRLVNNAGAPRCKKRIMVPPRYLYGANRIVSHSVSHSYSICPQPLDLGCLACDSLSPSSKKQGLRL